MILNNLKVEILILCETKVLQKEAGVWPGPGARQDARVSSRGRCETGERGGGSGAGSGMGASLPKEGQETKEGYGPVAAVIPLHGILLPYQKGTPQPASSIPDSFSDLYVLLCIHTHAQTLLK